MPIIYYYFALIYLTFSCFQNRPCADDLHVPMVQVSDDFDQLLSWKLKNIRHRPYMLQPRMLRSVSFSLPFAVFIINYGWCYNVLWISEFVAQHQLSLSCTFQNVPTMYSNFYPCENSTLYTLTVHWVLYLAFFIHNCIQKIYTLYCQRILNCLNLDEVGDVLSNWD